MGHFEPAGIRPLTRAYGAGMAMQQDSHRHVAVRGIRQAKPLKMLSIFK
jgi:hypothetical protein